MTVMRTFCCLYSLSPVNTQKKRKEEKRLLPFFTCPAVVGALDAREIQSLSFVFREGQAGADSFFFFLITVKANITGTPSNNGERANVNL